jgi:hypothetical protein
MTMLAIKQGTTTVSDDILIQTATMDLLLCYDSCKKCDKLQLPMVNKPSRKNRVPV